LNDLIRGHDVYFKRVTESIANISINNCTCKYFS
jgi:hypothetical protein